MTGAQFAYGAQEMYISWAACLQPPRPSAPLRRFDRVACLSSGRAGRRADRTYMKRVADSMTIRPAPAFFVNGAFVPRVEVDPVDMESSRRAHAKRPRLEEHDSLVQQDAPWSQNQLPSAKEIKDGYIEAATEVATALAREPTITDPHDLALARQGRFVRPIISTKRYPSGLETTHQGGRLIEHKSIPASLKMNLLEGVANAAEEMAVLRHAHIEKDANLEHLHAGAAELSIIADATEPDSSTFTPIVPPPRSPHKRKARLDAYSLDTKRSKANENTLFSSSTKNDSHTASHNITDPPRVFRVPSDTSSTTGIPDEEASPESPIRRPVGPTPSKWSRDELLNTPARRLRHSIGFNTTPLKMDAESSLLDAVGPSTPKLSPVPTSYDLTPTSFVFGDISPIGAHKAVAEASAADKTQSASKSWVKAFWSDKTRRRSEPLLNKNLRLPSLKQDQAQAESPSTPIAAEKVAVSTPQADTTQVSDATTPIPSYYTAGSFLARTPAYQKKREFNIDTRQNLDIFGAQASPIKRSPAKKAVSSATPGSVEQKPAKIEDLAEMAQNSCNGHAKVIVFHENDKLVVRFKMSPEYAALFPNSQGCDASPAVTSNSPQVHMPRENDSGRADDSGEGEIPSPLGNEGFPQNDAVNEGGNQPVETAQHMDSEDDSMEELSLVNIMSGLETPKSARTQPSPPSVKWSQAVHTEDETLIVRDFDSTCETPTQRQGGHASPAVRTPEGYGIEQDAPSSAVISELDFNVEFATPTHELNASPSANGTAFAGPPSSAKRTPSPVSAPEDDGSPTVRASFTPVNSPPTTQEVVKAEDEYENYEQAAHNANRDYLSAFINTHRNKSKPKRKSTTATGSPIATSPTRTPLGVKSPNAKSDSPAKGKRKLDEEKSPEKGKEPREPSPKKVRRSVQSAKPDVVASAPISSLAEDAEGPAATTAKTDGLVDVKTDDGSTMRRSSRLTAKTSIPTAIKINNRSGVTALPRPASNITRSEQVELARQTTANTKRNRGNAESVERTLVRCSAELSSEGSDSQSDDLSTKRSKDGKAVSWRDPLESYQDEKPKRGRPPAKAKLTQVKAGVTKSKPVAAKATPSKVARGLGMVANGTPAKRRPATRASTRGP